MSDWHACKVLERVWAAEGLFLVSLEATDPWAKAHLGPGQYVKVRIEGAGEAYFAVASAPGSRQLELLVKEGAAVATALFGLEPGATVELSLPGGKGFPMDRARGKDVLLIVTGTGVAAVRPVIELIRRERAAFGDVTLLFGARAPASFAFAKEFAAWEKDGVRLLCTVSQAPHEGWPGLRGYVQAHLGQLGVKNAVAFLVGQKAMVQSVTQALVDQGLPKEHVFLNF